MNILVEMFQYSFIVRAFIVGILVSVCASLLGVSLVLKRYSMIGDGLSHVSFGALSIAMAFGLAPLEISIPIVVLAAFFLLRMAENGKVKSDAAIALLSASALAIGIIITALTTGMNTDVCSYMFGSILAMSKEDVVLSILLSCVVLFMFVFSYHKIFAVTFDESFSRASGVNSSAYNTLISILTAVTIVLGMRMMGAMLISSLIIFPALTSMRLFKSFRGVIICSGIVSIVCFSVGMVISYGFSTPAGASIVVTNLGMFLLFYLLGKLKDGRGISKKTENKKKKAAVILGLGSLVLMLSGCGSETSSLKINDVTVENNTTDSQTAGIGSETTNLQSEDSIGDTSDSQTTEAATETTPATATTTATETTPAPNESEDESSSLLESAQDGEIIEITEKMYVTFINDIYTNTEDYLGKTLSIEGMYTSSYFVDTYTTYYYVYRVGPGCCGNDGNMCGFEFTFDGEMPEDNDWIKVVGTLEEYEENGVTYLTIKAESVTVMDQRGEEVVNVY